MEVIDIYYNGYIGVYKPEHHRAMNNGMVYEHILVAEEMLQRELREDEVVHHKDGCKTNNAPENLIVFRSKGDHTRFHMTGKLELLLDGSYISPLPRYGNSRKDKCPMCGAIKEKQADLCLVCYKDSKFRNSKKPIKDDLIELLKNHNQSEIGRMFGVSSSAVKKWIKSYGLNHMLRGVNSVEE